VKYTYLKSDSSLHGNRRVVRIIKLFKVVQQQFTGAAEKMKMKMKIHSHW
jgi:hypothetical protein